MGQDFSTSTKANEPDRRAHERRRVLRGATLRFNKGYNAFECRVRDQSDGGARLVFGDTLAVPSMFDLEISGGTPQKAVVRWRNQTDMGVTLA